MKKSSLYAVYCHIVLSIHNAFHNFVMFIRKKFPKLYFCVRDVFHKMRSRVTEKYIKSLLSVNFLFVYEVKARELDNICLLAMELQDRGYTVAFINTWYSIGHKIPGYNADVVVIPACYGEGSYEFFSNHAAKFRKVIDLQWEQLRFYLALEAKNQTAWTFSDIACETRHICWGDNTKNRLRKQYGVREDCLKTTGYLSLDFYREKLRGTLSKRSTLFEKYNLDPRKRTVIFLSSFALANTPKNVLDAFSDDYRQQLEQFYRSNQRAMINWIDYALERNKTIQFIYRPHPAEMCDSNVVDLEKKHENLFVIHEESIKQWFNTVDVIYNWNSTSIIEAYASGKTTYLLQPLPMKKLFTYPILEGCRAITEVDAFCATLESSDTSKKYCFPIAEEKIREYYSINQNQPTYIRVCDFLEETFKDESYTSKALERFPRSISKRRKNAKKTEMEVYTECLAERNYASEQEINDLIHSFRRHINDHCINSTPITNL